MPYGRVFAKRKVTGSVSELFVRSDTCHQIFKIVIDEAQSVNGVPLKAHVSWQVEYLYYDNEHLHMITVPTLYQGLTVHRQSKPKQK
jgi:hypothetical protein